MLALNIHNETSRLRAVVLGQPKSMGSVPYAEKTYDARSYETVIEGKYPDEETIVMEMNAFEKILVKHDIKVFRPDIIENCNQVFSRDVGFVIDDKIINCNIIPDREDEKEAYAHIYSEISFNKIYNLPERAHVEGGDVVLHNDLIFVGLYTQDDYPNKKTARTNLYALHFLEELFHEKEFIGLELNKNDRDPHQGVLHLDCTFMPVGTDKAIIYPGGFRNRKDLFLIKDIFGEKNLFEISNEEMYQMNSNVFSLAPDLLVSEKSFIRLNRHLKDCWGIRTEELDYLDIAKMGGLLRCSTLPLVRES